MHYKLDLEEINEKAIKAFQMPFKVKKQIKKLKRKRSILPHPEVVSVILNGRKSININFKASLLTKTIVQICRLISTSHSTHDFTKHYALSNTYFKKVFTSFNSHRPIINLFLNNTYRGNTMHNSKGCSSFTFTNNPYENSEVIYTRAEKVKELLTEVLRTNDIKEYIKSYNVIKNQKKEKNKLMLTDTKQGKRLRNKAKKSKKLSILAELSAKITKENESIFTKELGEDVISSISWEFQEAKKIIKYYKEHPEEEKDYVYFNATTTIKSLNRLKPYIHNRTLYYKQSQSSVGRTYNVLNSIDKRTRKKVFSDYTELDITNAAPNILANILSEVNPDSELLKPFKNIIKHNKEHIMILTRIICNKKSINIRSRIAQEVKGYLKKNLLAVLFGSKNNSDFLRVSDVSVSNLERFCISAIRDYCERLDYYSLVRKIAKELGCKVKELAGLFMKKETLIMTELMAILNKNTNKNGIIHIHDGILIPNSLLDTITYDQYEEIEKLLNKHGVVIPNLEDLYCYIKFTQADYDKFAKKHREAREARENKKPKTLKIKGITKPTKKEISKDYVQNPVITETHKMQEIYNTSLDEIPIKQIE